MIKDIRSLYEGGEEPTVTVASEAPDAEPAELVVQTPLSFRPHQQTEAVYPNLLGDDDLAMVQSTQRHYNRAAAAYNTQASVLEELREALQVAEIAANAVGNTIRERYGLREQDQLQLESGRIIRGGRSG